MKEKIYILLLLFISVCVSGCNTYITAQSQDNIYYGILKQRDLLHADVKMIKKEPYTVCDGVAFLNPKSRLLSYKDDYDIDANILLGCSDKTLIKARLKVENRKFKNPTGRGYDQLDNLYIFSAVSGGEFRRWKCGQKIDVVDDNMPSLLKF